MALCTKWIDPSGAIAPLETSQLRGSVSIELAMAISILAGFGVVALLVTWSGIKVAQNNYDLGKKVSVIQQRNDVASLENQNLKLKNKYYESNEFLELAARRQFGRAAAGEKMYIVPSDVSLKSTVEMPQEISKST